MMNTPLRRSFSSFGALARLFSISLCAALLIDAGCSADAEPVGEPPPVEDLNNIQQASVSCVQSTGTGYVDGEAFKITLATIDGKPAEIRTANAYVVMQDAAAKASVKISVVSGFRTYAEQQYFYNCYVNCNCNNCNQAAKPGYSNHQSGHALDLNTSSSGVLTWLNKNGATYGFKRTVASEDWHWEWWGGGPGGGPCDASGVSTPCKVTATGKSGECLDKTACLAQANHEATPGYCPGPSNYQCCTATTPPIVDAGADTGTAKDSAVDTGSAKDSATADTGSAKDSATADTGSAKDSATADTAMPQDTGLADDADPGQDAQPEEDANPDQDGAVKDATSNKDGSTQDSSPAPISDSGSDSGGCSLTGSVPHSNRALAALFVAFLAVLSSRRSTRSRRR